VEKQNQTKTHISENQEFDVVVIGAGINGAVAAAALSAAGKKTLLIDRGDFASFTSQESSSLVWGGIKYLQTYEFALVLKLCMARNKLMRSYPNQIKEIGFLASLGPTAPFGRLLGTFGTLFYWGIGAFGTLMPKSYSANAAKELEPGFKSGRKAVLYYDAYLPDTDARFVFDFVSHAISSGATVSNYTNLASASFENEAWQLGLTKNGKSIKIKANAVVNATGPFSGEVAKLLESPTKASLVFSKGVHLTLGRKIAKGDNVLAFWDEQERLFYVLPMGDRSMIGTTDTRVQDPHTALEIEDTEFVLKQINAQLELANPITKADIVSFRSGVRPLVVEGGASGEVADWHQLSRKHVIETNSQKRVVTILGGKLTDCLNVGQEVVDEFKKFGPKLKKPKGWFGESDQSRKSEFFTLISQKTNTAQAAVIAQGIWRRHGEAGFEIVKNFESLADLVPGLGITLAELSHIKNFELVVNREDLLRRRLPIAMARSRTEIEENKELQAALLKLGL
jgi:glycerol-3-phosphate dehydrogenase